MQLEQFPMLLGLSNTDDAVIRAIAAHDASVTELSAKKLSAEGSDFVELKAKGLSLAFVPRSAFEQRRGTPCGAGPYILAGLLYHPAGANGMDAYTGSAPLAQGTVHSRDQAQQAYGPPERSMDDDGVPEWDQWTIEGRQLRINYRDGNAVESISISVPLLKR